MVINSYPTPTMAGGPLPYCGVGGSQLSSTPTSNHLQSTSSPDGPISRSPVFARVHLSEPFNDFRPAHTSHTPRTDNHHLTQWPVRRRQASPAAELAPAATAARSLAYDTPAMARPSTTGHSTAQRQPSSARLALPISSARWSLTPSARSRTSRSWSKSAYLQDTMR